MLKSGDSGSGYSWSKFFTLVPWTSIWQDILLSDLAAHLLTTAFLILAFFATIIQLFHRADREYLRLKHEPGTIASAVCIGAQTGVGDVLAGRHAEGDIEEALRNKKFRIDPVTMKIVMHGEDGYETAAIPPIPFYKRISIREFLPGSRANCRPSQNPLAASVTPTTPRSPSFIQPKIQPSTPPTARTLLSSHCSGGSLLESTGVSCIPLDSTAELSWTPLDPAQLPNSSGTIVNGDTSPRSASPHRKPGVWCYTYDLNLSILDPFFRLHPLRC